LAGSHAAVAPSAAEPASGETVVSVLEEHAVPAMAMSKPMDALQARKVFKVMLLHPWSRFEALAAVRIRRNESVKPKADWCVGLMQKET
jgi:hypothetical protein